MIILIITTTIRTSVSDMSGDKHNEKHMNLDGPLECCVVID